MNLWQRRYWEHQIRDELDSQANVDYIHFNPVKFGYVEQTHAWPFLTFHRYVRLGILDDTWVDGGVEGGKGQIEE